MRDKVIAAVVVLYYSRPDELDRLLRSVIDQVNMVFVVDNTPNPIQEVAMLVARFAPRACYFPLMENMGIAAAQNIGIEKSTAALCSHVLLLDQDSALPGGMVESLLTAEAVLLRDGREVGAIGPQFIDEKSRRPSASIRHRSFWIQRLYLDPDSVDPVETDHVIASGSMIRTSVLQHIGLMREDFFIDWVDIEWCMRARSKGYISYYAPNAVMKHSVGDSVVTVLGRDVHLHNDLRNYYMLRNAVYLFRLKSMGWRWKINFAPRIPCYLVLYPLLSKRKMWNLRLVLKALSDGMRGRLGKLQQVAEQR
ncbi:MAG TPA: glycosyltransferase family 2 protein [Terracidiphilus sp.]|jgi:rhamnosyltransferase